MTRIGFAVVLLLALVADLAAPGPMRAAAPPEAVPLPDEPGAHELEGLAFGAVVADLDGDGVRELVRLVSEAGAGGRLGIDAWHIGANGTATAIGAQRLRRGASVDEVIDGFRQIDRDQMLPVGIDEPAQFVIWHDGTRERLLVATIGTTDLPVACCLTVWAVGIGRDGGLSLTLLANTQDNATSVRAVDLDGDGTDELFVTQQPAAASPTQVPVRALRWESGRFRQLRGQFIAPPGWQAFVPGETDGRPGSEVLISADRVDDGPGALLYRIWLAADGIQVESEPVSDRGQLAAVSTRNGPRLVLVPPETGSILELEWAPGALIRRVAAVAVSGQLLGVLRDGDDARVLVAAERDVLASLDPAGSVFEAQFVTTMSAAALRFTGRLSAYSGPLPGGLPGGTPAFVFGGQLITAAEGVASGGPPAVAQMASLPGIVPIGVLGAGGAWMALLPIAGYDVARDGGPLIPRTLIPAAPITLAPTSLVLSPERDDGALRAGLPEITTAANGTSLLSGSDSIQIEVAAPVGSRVIVDAGLPPSLRPARAELTLRNGRGRVALPATKDEAAAGRLRLSVVVVTPAGHGYGEVRTVELRLRPPPLEVAAAAWPLSFEVPVSGVTAPDARVTVDGRQVQVGDAGRFTADVGGGLLPREVRVEAIDPVGNASQQMVSVVAPADYRRLPWIPIVVGLTLLAGGFLLLRVPRARAQVAQEPGDDARLEEIDPR
jgi:hypothetical protein